jgi:phage terminase small subunit
MKNSKPKPKKRELTLKQQKFVAYYSGNGADAARKAGYSGDENVLKSIAFENLTKPYIRAAIKKRNDDCIEPLIATRMDRQKFWSKVMTSPRTTMRDRLKAAELLGKSEADFTDNVNSNSLVKTELRIVNEDEVNEEVVKFIEKFKA